LTSVFRSARNDPLTRIGAVFGTSVGTAHAYVTTVTGLLADRASDPLKTLREHDPDPVLLDGTLAECRRQPVRLSHLPRREAHRRADELLERFGLMDAADRQVIGYSGGMRRRLDLITSLILSPEVLFLDEPTTGLDPRSRGEIWDSIRELVAGGTTVLLTTQYLDVFPTHSAARPTNWPTTSPSSTTGG
jgi:ABC-type dipeptide/oligopeptide/nickel transport system ATPase component